MSTDTTESGERTTCEECGLPYYAAADACPYCESASASGAESEDVSPGGNEPSAPRSRETCAECGLPYDADANDDCPYCESADTDRSDSAEPASGSESDTAAESEAASGAELDTEPEPRAREEPPTADASERTDTEPSLVERISETVRSMLKGR